jgi:hypothetical protein
MTFEVIQALVWQYFQKKKTLYNLRDVITGEFAFFAPLGNYIYIFF